MFIALEGIGGSGKGTLKEKLFKLLENHKVHFIRTREPGGTPIAEELRNIVRGGFTVDAEPSYPTPMATTLLFNAARADHVDRLVRPSLLKDKVVVCDRFCDSTFVYQNVMMGIELPKLRQLHDLVIGIYPDMTFLLDCPADVAMARITPQEKSTDQFDRADVETQENMRKAYLALAMANPERYCIINAAGTPESIWEQVEPYFMKNLMPRIKHEEYIYSSQWAE